MSSHPLYPGNEETKRLVKEAKQAAYKESLPHFLRHGMPSTSSLLWRILHIAIVSPVVENIDLHSWFAENSDCFDHFCGTISDEETRLAVWREQRAAYRSTESRLVDVDLCDARGSIFQLRLVWMDWKYTPMRWCGARGFAFDRAGKEILFEIGGGHFGGWGHTVRRTSAMDKGDFAFPQDHPVSLLASMVVGDSFGFNVVEMAEFGQNHSSENIAEFLLDLALYVVRQGEEPNMAYQLPNSDVMMEAILSSLDDRQSGHQLAARVLADPGAPGHAVVSAYAAQPYVAVPRGHDRSMDWYTQPLEFLRDAMLCLQRGDEDGLVAALERDPVRRFPGIKPLDPDQARAQVMAYQSTLLGRDCELFPCLATANTNQEIL